ncbi:MAG TPA: hypothetical protein VEC01_17185 [Noviherbaspirillum sp.]|uniref:hypothetical protein n=1 Tax=Noviherbaspirillum sp. TaxID=1926288 RepID=UPI002D40B43E|nr:hypothetical protein [Noviherbaspirillum sp.]HYD97066.1 hypothetical protein [Noviherbaspirillum sp.]
MFRSAKSAALLMAVAVFAGVLSGCEKRETTTGEKGPAEQAGQKVDQAASRAGEELNKVAEKAGQGLQQLGQKLQSEAEQAQQQQPKKE